ncbi:MAG: hypothetical protein JKY22_04595 [Flavobacteriaceae bacterium]|nr:hypothetical protein [Flavobacteriaceae bacterium]
MKPYALLFCLLFFISTPLFPQQNTSINFPNDYFGIYTGTLKISNKKGTQTYPMEFHFQPTDSVGKYEYKLIYGIGDNKQERPYNLIAEDAASGLYIVDENNGIILHDKVIDNRMYTLFEVGNNLLTTFITFEKDHMIFEIAVTDKTEKQISYADDEEKTKVISYPISTVQRAVLQKQ